MGNSFTNTFKYCLPARSLWDYPPQRLFPRIESWASFAHRFVGGKIELIVEQQNKLQEDMKCYVGSWLNSQKQQLKNMDSQKSSGEIVHLKAKIQAVEQGKLPDELFVNKVEKAAYDLFIRELRDFGEAHSPNRRNPIPIGLGEVERLAKDRENEFESKKTRYTSTEESAITELNKKIAEQLQLLQETSAKKRPTSHIEQQINQTKAEISLRTTYLQETLKGSVNHLPEQILKIRDMAILWRNFAREIAEARDYYDERARYHERQQQAIQPAIEPAILAAPQQIDALNPFDQAQLAALR